MTDDALNAASHLVASMCERQDIQQKKKAITNTKQKTQCGGAGVAGAKRSHMPRSILSDETRHYVNYNDVSLYDINNGQYDHVLIRLPAIDEAERRSLSQRNHELFCVKFDDDHIRLQMYRKEATHVHILRALLQHSGYDLNKVAEGVQQISLDPLNQSWYSILGSVINFEQNVLIIPENYATPTYYAYNILRQACVSQIFCGRHSTSLFIENTTTSSDHTGIYMTSQRHLYNVRSFSNVCHECLTLLILYTIAHHKSIITQVLLPTAVANGNGDAHALEPVTLRMFSDIMYASLQTAFEYIPSVDLPNEQLPFERLYAVRPRPSQGLPINAVDLYDVFDYAIATKITTLILALALSDILSIRSVKCHDRLEKMVLMMDSQIQINDHQSYMDHLFMVYAGTFTRLGIAGFSLVPYNANGHNGIDSQIRGTSFLSPFASCTADHVANTPKVITIPQCITLNSRAVDVYVRIERAERIPVHVRPIIRNAIANALMKDLLDMYSIPSSVCDSRLRYMMKNNPSDVELIHIHKTVRPAIRGLLKPMVQSSENGPVYNRALLDVYKKLESFSSVLDVNAGFDVHVTLKVITQRDPREGSAFVLPPIAFTPITWNMALQINATLYNRMQELDD